ncbi:MAG: hypothetical protein JO102_07560, partial [Elusimicrobia bacterium]|nr:hypothetical protein [Elusimicrobiota bacterium]
ADGQITGVRRSGQIFLVFSPQATPAAEMSMMVNPEQSLVPRVRPESRPDSQSIVKSFVDSQVSRSSVGQTVQVVRNRVAKELAQAAAEPEGNDARKLKEMRAALESFASELGISIDPNRLDEYARGFVRLFNLRVTPMRVGNGRVYFSEDQGSGQTIMPANIESYIPNFLPNVSDELRSELTLMLYEAFAQTFRVRRSDELSLGADFDQAKYRARRERAIARWNQRMPSFLKLTGSQGAPGEMILLVMELLDGLPLNNLNANGILALRLAHGIDLSAGRDQATRIGHYKEPEYKVSRPGELGQPWASNYNERGLLARLALLLRALLGRLVGGTGELGVQPTIFQWRELIETFLHEFGHVNQSQHIDENFAEEVVGGQKVERKRSAEEIRQRDQNFPLLAWFDATRQIYALPALGGSPASRRGYIGSYSERFAETFMHFVLHGKEFKNGFAGYLVTDEERARGAQEDPASVEAWKQIYEYYANYVFGSATERVDFVNGQMVRTPRIRQPFALPAAPAPQAAPVQAAREAKPAEPKAPAGNVVTRSVERLSEALGKIEALGADATADQLRQAVPSARRDGGNLLVNAFVDENGEIMAVGNYNSLGEELQGRVDAGELAQIVLRVSGLGTQSMRVEFDQQSGIPRILRESSDGRKRLAAVFIGVTRRAAAPAAAQPGAAQQAPPPVAPQPAAPVQAAPAAQQAAAPAREGAAAQPAPLALPEANVGQLRSSDFIARVRAANRDRPGNVVTVDVAVDGEGRIVATGTRDSFEASLGARIANEEVFVTAVRVTLNPGDGPALALGGTA